MNYNELQSLCEQRKLQIKDVTNALEMSYTGLRDSLNRDSLPIKKLKPLCRLLDMSPNEFLRWESQNRHEYNTGILGGTGKYIDNKNIETLNSLIEQIKIKDDQIDKLIDLLNNKYQK